MKIGTPLSYELLMDVTFSPPKILDESIPFAEGKDLIVEVPVDARGVADVYIDNTISLTVDVENSNNVQRLEQAIHCAARDKHVIIQFQGSIRRQGKI